MEDNQLIARALEGDSHSFKELYTRHSTAAWSVAMYICANETLAKDAVQVAFTNVFQYLSSFNEKSSFKTWLLRIVKNECFRIMKLETKFECRDIEADKIQWEDSAIGIEESLHLKDIKNWVGTILDNMKYKEGLVLKMFYLQELKVAEIAEILDCSVGSVKVNMHRARVSFRNLIKSSKLAEY